MSNTKKILVVDDSQMIRKGLMDIFEQDEAFEVVGEAANGEEALEAIKRLQPDIVTLDVIMPGMSGITTLKHIMIENPRPTVMLSSLTQDGSTTTFDALRYGAVDFISKPSRVEDDVDMNMLGEDIIKKINAAADVNVGVASYIRPLPDNVVNEDMLNLRCDKLVGLGAAEGGYGSLMKIIPGLERVQAAYLVVLYVNDDHLDAFISYINKHSRVRVKRAQHDEILEAGVCYLSSGADYMTVHETDEDMVLHISPAPFATRRGSIDRLFFSIAEIMETNAIGVMLSGSGVDGAEGLEEINRVGGAAIVQDPKTCLAKEMSQAAMNAITPEYVISDIEVATNLNGLLHSE